MLLDAKDMRIPLKFHKITWHWRWNLLYSISHLQCQVPVCPVSRPPFGFPVELASNCAQGDVAISSGDFGTFKSKRGNVEFASIVDLRPLIQWSPSLSHFHHKIIHTTFTSGDVIR